MAKRIGRPNRPYDPEFAVEAGAALLPGLLEKFERDEQLALFGYARGSGSVRKWKKNGGPQLPRGVRRFIGRVRRAQATFEDLGFPGHRQGSSSASGLEAKDPRKPTAEPRP